MELDKLTALVEKMRALGVSSIKTPEIQVELGPLPPAAPAERANQAPQPDLPSKDAILYAAGTGRKLQKAGP